MMAESGMLGGDDRRSPRTLIRESFISGMAVVVPMLITVLVLTIAINSIYQYLDLFSDYLKQLPIITIIPGVLNITAETLIELMIPPLIIGSILFVGIVVNSSRYGERAVDYFDYAISEIPGVGSVYESFRQMSDVMLESDAQNFREVKLVEFPHEGAYTLGFVTTETPEPLREPTGHQRMVTLFLPLAPNPVMGGHLVHMPEEKVMDVDMTVEEGIRAVVTSGVAVSSGSAGGEEGLSPAEMRELGAVEHADQQFSPEQSSPDVRRDERVRTDRTERYDKQVSPEQATTAHDIVRREREEGEAETPADIDAEETPADLESETESVAGDERIPSDIELNTSQEETELTPTELEQRRATEQSEWSGQPTQSGEGSEGDETAEGAEHSPEENGQTEQQADETDT